MFWQLGFVKGSVNFRECVINLGLSAWPSAIKKKA